MNNNIKKLPNGDFEVTPNEVYTDLERTPVRGEEFRFNYIGTQKNLFKHKSPYSIYWCDITGAIKIGGEILLPTIYKNK